MALPSWQIVWIPNFGTSERGGVRAEGTGSANVLPPSVLISKVAVPITPAVATRATNSVCDDCDTDEDPIEAL